MPLLRYFIFTAGVLLSLLFLLDWYLPAASVTEARSDIDHSVIRIHSRHKWPEAIRMDTSAPLVTAAVPAPIAVAAEASAPRTPPAKLTEIHEPQAALRKGPERHARRAKPTRQARREARPRPAMREVGQRVASYRTPDWFGWPSASW
ncbi:hypothetical protein JQ633_30390 [Bradyrhizobium tropiciagri]|uniref:hypothetical protein n=1 Tax=Bradyrhizobium tropiciagri TaxID=312253 RepID=UPI001BA99466|nr:hypothetical protein [Bradyrhizobium tropiciagri]MBR0874703.1 hypothetical protein [Bradyrhizobium tropiciagri]